mmetsp:Transcript_43817/g.141268  ORF Transcript_43817/g.141268 Transcript_43817/m.141268 type:complete len:221 (-) Transcript_43817:287-949(-)
MSLGRPRSPSARPSGSSCGARPWRWPCSSWPASRQSSGAGATAGCARTAGIPPRPAGRRKGRRTAWAAAAEVRAEAAAAEHAARRRRGRRRRHRSPCSRMGSSTWWRRFWDRRAASTVTSGTIGPCSPNCAPAGGSWTCTATLEASRSPPPRRGRRARMGWTRRRPRSAWRRATRRSTASAACASSASRTCLLSSSGRAWRRASTWSSATRPSWRRLSRT